MKTKNGAPVVAKVDIEPYLESLRAVSNLLDESVYVVDFHHRCFRFVSENGIFLSGLASEDVLSLGYDYYQKIIHPEDYPMAEKMYQEIVRYFTHPASLNDLIYAKISFRTHKTDGLMMQHRVTPLIVNNQARMAICTVHHTKDTPGNLCAYHRNKDVYYQYSLDSGRWKQEPVISLKPREKRILELSKAGITRQEIADILRISLNTLRNVEASIYDKLKVRSRAQAVSLASNNRLIFVPDHSNNRKVHEEQPNEKKNRRRMTPDKLPRIQEALNNGQSVNSIAKQEGVSEFSIRYAIKNGKLKKIIRE